MLQAVAPQWRIAFLWCLGPFLWVLGLWSATPTEAGATASQWVVVVNGESQNSRTIANHYCQLRGIPSRNVIVLKDVPARESISANEFREKILEPLLAEMSARGLSSHVQGIAYSADFPTAIDFLSDTLTLKDRSHFLLPTGSINGLTYLYRICRAKSPSVLNMDINFYACREAKFLLEKSPPEILKTEWESFAKELETGEASKAKAMLEKMVNQFPSHCGLTYLAARLWAKQDKPEPAIQLLEIALNQGWCYRDYLVNDPAFEKLRELTAFQVLRDACPEISWDHQRSRGFDARSFWLPSGVPSNVEKEGMAYLLSTVLAVTRGDGNTVEEALAYLRRSAEADFTLPEGKFYFSKTEDVRTTTREPQIQIARNRLKQLGYDSEVVSDRMPMFQQSCLGVTMGTPLFNWKASASQLAPGAIAENLTSLGGAMATMGVQTKLTEYLRHGAAGSSGAVVEPYTIEAKFPHAMIHAHYADGATLAEAFYLSVRGPYQLLIVGDPLCQPFAKPPKVKVEGLQNGARLNKKVLLRLSCQDATGDEKPGRIDLLLDGKLTNTFPYVDRLSFDIGSDVPPGAHTLSLIFTDSSYMQRKWEYQAAILVGDKGNDIETKVEEPTKTGPKSHNHKIVVTGPEKSKLRLMHHWETVGQIAASHGTFDVDLEKFGKGPVRFHVVAVEGKAERMSLPIVIESK